MRFLKQQVILCILVVSITTYSSQGLSSPMKDDISPVIPIGEEFMREGVAQRYWGINVNLQPWNNHTSISSMTTRINQVGFNAIRLWPNWNTFYGSNVKTGFNPPRQGFNFKSYSKGDGSQLDNFDYMVYQCRQNNLSIYMTSLMYYPPIYSNTKFSDLIITNQHDKEEWTEAVKGFRWEKGIYDPWWGLHYFDERFQAIWEKHATLFLNHTNPYTGLKYADDNNIVMWQIHNESRFLDKFMLNDEYRTPAKKGKAFPQYFQDKIKQQYNSYLFKKYGTTKALLAVWGQLEEGESLEKNNIDASIKKPGAELYNTARKNDFTAFVFNMVAEWNNRFTQLIRKQATNKHGGVAVTAITNDTYSWATLPHYSSIYNGDFIAFGNYPNPQGKRVKAEKVSKPWSLYLSKTGAWGPFDFTRPYGKPSVIYETNYNQFSLYDSELPWLLSTFSSWQNINGVFFYFWNAPYKREQPVTYGEKIFTYRGHEIWGDDIFTASIQAAGEAYLNRVLPTAENPTVFSYSQDITFDYDWENWSYKGNKLKSLKLNGFELKNINNLRKYIVGSSFANGSRVRVVKNQSYDLMVTGPKPTKMRLRNEVKFGDNVVWSSANSSLKIDLPTLKAYVGLNYSGDIHWSDDFSLSDINVGELSKGMLHDPFVAISLLSLDDKPLAVSNNIHLFAHSHSYNVDMKINKKGKVTSGRFKTVSRKIKAKLSLPFDEIKNVQFRDFKFKSISALKIKSELKLEGNMPVYDALITSQ